MELPNMPSVANQAKANVPICIPWTRKPIFLAKGLAISEQSSVELRPSPLESPDNYIFEPTDATNSFRQVFSSNATASSEHLDVNFGVSVGGSLLGASVRGEFMKNVAQNRDSSKVSLHASLRVGQITFGAFPKLSARALSLLRTSPDTFHATYGSYFVYALSIGADTSTFLSTSTGFDLAQELRDIQVKAKFLFITKTVYEDHSRSDSNETSYDINYDGFDTLANYQGNMRATDADLFHAIQLEAARNVANGKQLVDRVKDILKGIGIDCEKETPLTREQIDATFAKGPLRLQFEHIQATQKPKSSPFK